MQETDSSIDQLVTDIGKRAKAAAGIIATASTNDKNNALLAASDALIAATNAIISANNLDMAAAKAKGLDDAMLDRLALDEKRIHAMAQGLREIAELDDPVGQITESWDRPSGLNIRRMRVPLGVIGIIYESRPNVTADAGALCLKSGNVAILRGGSESTHSSKAIADCLHQGLEAAGLPKDAILQIPTQDRAAVGKMLTLNQYIDIIVPRGGKGLCKRVQDESRIPTLQHLDGNCHTYVHENANIDMAVSVIHNAKLRRTGICGATESLIIDQEIASHALPKIVDDLVANGCEIRGDDQAVTIDSRIHAASDDDWGTEYLDNIISVKIVKNIDQAIDFVNKYSSGHTDAIITDSDQAAQRYLRCVDSAIVMHNTSTQFADGGEFGMGAEIGISTGRLHARGPVGAAQLTTYKYVVSSDGSVRP